jgi:predicted cupin superfamily sugar epimerase
LGNDASALITRLGLQPHPEGGWYREVFRSAQRVSSGARERAALTTIYYLLERGQWSRWHVVASDEPWHFHSGAPLELHVYEPSQRLLGTHRLGDAAGGAEALCAVPAGHWQAARSLGGYSLVSCDVGPGFEFADFRLIASLPDHVGHFSGPLAALRALL